MAVSYNKLRKLLIDRNLKKKDLEELAHLSKYTMLCIARNESVNSEALARICKALNCNFDDIMEITE
jgi:DNA-binding Xre family transcriptional regulator